MITASVDFKFNDGEFQVTYKLDEFERELFVTDNEVVDTLVRIKIGKMIADKISFDLPVRYENG